MSLRLRPKPIKASDATTAWGLLEDVREAILAEPKRANMRVYVEGWHPWRGGPACGTVGCLAGWIALLSGRANRQSLLDFDASQAMSVVRNVLGSTLDYYTVGRGGERNEGGWVFNSGTGDACWSTKPGTPEHAAAVVDRLDRFMRINERALKARKTRRGGKAQYKAYEK